VIVQGFYLICYYIEHPLIERYKCLEEPWPWNDDPEQWNKLFWRSCKLYFVNFVLLTPLAYLPFY